MQNGISDKLNLLRKLCTQYWMLSTDLIGKNIWERIEKEIY